MATPLPNIQHVILLMFENRSFDNVLGAFYASSPDGGGVPSTGFSGVVSEYVTTSCKPAFASASRTFSSNTSGSFVRSATLYLPHASRR